MVGIVGIVVGAAMAVLWVKERSPCSGGSSLDSVRPVASLSRPVGCEDVVGGGYLVGTGLAPASLVDDVPLLL